MVGTRQAPVLVRLFVWSSNMFNSDLTDITQTLLLPALLRHIPWANNFFERAVSCRRRAGAASATKTRP
eukprot:scaffold68372_cov64-Phaeocystis_antarctica.AAC.4